MHSLQINYYYLFGFLVLLMYKKWHNSSEIPLEVSILLTVSILSINCCYNISKPILYFHCICYYINKKAPAGTVSQRMEIPDKLFRAGPDHFIKF